MSGTVLLVEDNQHKRERILQFVRQNFPTLVVEEAHSYSSACRSAKAKRFDLLIFDMTLPTYDRSPTESGGKVRTLGGREVARKILRRGSDAKIVFLTQYDAFSDNGKAHTLDSLGRELEAECGLYYRGLIYYEGSQSAWKDKLGKVLAEASNAYPDC